MNDQEMVSERDAAGGAKVVTKFRRLRVWPAVALVVLMVLARFVPAFLEGGYSRYWMVSVFGPFLCCVLLVIWWLTASRATWRERVFGFLGLVAALGVTVAGVHPTMRGPGTTYLTLPMGMVLFGVAAAVLAGRRPVVRTGLAVLLALVGFSYSMLLRNEGMTGDYVMVTPWRWKKSAEATMLAARGDARSKAEVKGQTNLAAVSGASLAKAEWPGFRGADRSGVWRGPQIATNWASNSPRQLWKIPVGPGWSSFAVAGRLLFTQEQRGAMEAAVCYDAESGREVWSRQFEARLEDPMGGPGPRATPTIAMIATTGTNTTVGEGSALFVTGGTGIFMRLDPATGAVVWQQDLKSVAGRAVPMWGYSASPLVVGSVVIVYGGGAGEKGLLAFDVATGTLRWGAPAGADSYSSPQLNMIAGEELVLLLSNEGLVCVTPATGKVRLNYAWKFNGYRALQPIVAGDIVVLHSPMTPGTRAIRISKKDGANGGELAAEELWSAGQFKPDFTDFVERGGFLYGIDGGFLTCVDVKAGERKWKGGRYGKGQVLLLENSAALLVAAEDGRVVLVRTEPGEHVELGAFKALEGKTWNHPVVVGDRLYVRNAQEAACFQLALKHAADAGGAGQ
jgi:outer membrane protein assembly factor BamB